MTVSVAIVGFGLAGRYLHAPLIKACGMQVNAVVTSRTEAVHCDFPDAVQYDDFDTMIERDDIDLVILTTPNEFHYPQALTALERSKHVVIEKPFTIQSSEARTLIEAAEQRDLTLSVYHNRRWDCDCLTILDLLRRNLLGNVTSATLRWDRFRPTVTDRWRDADAPGAGLLYDLGPHLIDQAVLFFGKPDWLQADVFIQRPGGRRDDGFEILLGKGRLRISIGVNYLTVDGLPRYIINGDKGTFRKSWLDPQEHQLRHLRLDPKHDDFGKEAPERWGALHHPDGTLQTVPSHTGRWLSFYDQMRAAIENKKPAPVLPRSALYVMQIIEAAFDSSRQEKRINLDAINAD